MPFVAADGFEYLDYRPHPPGHYLTLTRRLAALVDPVLGMPDGAAVDPGLPGRNVQSSS